MPVSKWATCLGKFLVVIRMERKEKARRKQERLLARLSPGSGEHCSVQTGRKPVSWVSILSFLSMVFWVFSPTLISPSKLWSPYGNEKPDTLCSICISLIRKSSPNLLDKLLTWATTTFFYTVFSCKPHRVILGLSSRNAYPTHPYQSPLDSPTSSCFSTKDPWVISFNHFHSLVLS